MPGVTTGRLQIGDVAERTGLSLRTIRHYDEVGLLPASQRSPGGFRLYTEAAVDRLLVIKQMKPLGFALGEMRDLLEVLDRLDAPTGAGDRAGLRDRLVAHEHVVAERIGELRQRLRAAERFDRMLRERLDEPTTR